MAFQKKKLDQRGEQKLLKETVHLAMQVTSFRLKLGNDRLIN